MIDTQSIQTVLDSDMAMWFVSTSALSAVIIPIISFIRANIYPLQGAQVIGASLVLGLVLALAGEFLGFLLIPWPQAVVFGLSAGVGASGFVDAARDMRREKVASNDTNGANAP